MHDTACLYPHKSTLEFVSFCRGGFSLACHSQGYCLNGRNLGVAFRLPPWLADVPLFPAICGREDWQAWCGPNASQKGQEAELDK